MLCNECKEKVATIHLTNIINGRKIELHLCEECAKKNKYLEAHFSDDPFMFNQFLTNLVDNTIEDKLKKNNAILLCNNCGTSYEQFREIGRFGCPDCYNVFSEKLHSLYKRLHGHDKHIGKLPTKSSDKIKIEKKIKKLKEELQEAIEKEAFEEAVILRDRIKELANKLQEK
ncbi:UvrB/UvrC motif-containing protein [Clostridiaceae bacterium M8S5]|nr:UvrB/UvrC motif-containing protein [Clostridiaceae bacterium M8S5]